jgi:hypothetical protein
LSTSISTLPELTLSTVSAIVSPTKLCYCATCIYHLT